jgi:hypothetical protein
VNDHDVYTCVYFDIQSIMCHNFTCSKCILKFVIKISNTTPIRTSSTDIVKSNLFPSISPYTTPRLQWRTVRGMTGKTVCRRALAIKWASGFSTLI